ncbi:2-octaprenyl-6-methoxyphenyl hydroxylase [Caldichromatium japonicum]|uniref:2-octaprenyl-6-methoxyphenyl hydroxylase n=1 Tax=Caldichromatium japonicum TaxID=2699430 RepID=A0A6G7VA99_9GAMM|nr:2-octaprenyl-6-methoxyphenyl hydroxylase [Caldichromatium japonicum]QIK36882.1 2-octaprenyl-6-methoxyphenyl hydroxylase [Caldichromatium japonicum]
MTDFDVVIAGRGLVGGSLACALRHLPLKMALIESTPAGPPHQPGPDDRVIALSLGSRQILGGTGLWPAIAPLAEPIRCVHVSERGACGFTRINHREEGVEALGYVTPARVIERAIEGALETSTGLKIFRPARLAHHYVRPGRVELEIELAGQRQTLSTRLLVAADGHDSGIRKRLGIRVEGHDYGQDAVITTVEVSRPRPGWAFERFTDTGPLAFLPMTGGRYSVVWCCHPEQTPELMALDDASFVERLQARFGWRLGRLGLPSLRQVHSLKLRFLGQTVHERLILIGNAAHTLHPVAGQGFNLGLRDVAALASVLDEVARAGQDPGDSATLAAYRRWRGRDQQLTAMLTDTLARVFVPSVWPLRLARNLGLLGLDLTPPARHRLARHLMGLDGPRPRLPLAGGIELEGSYG